MAAEAGGEYSSWSSLCPGQEVWVICGSFGVPNGFKDTSPRSQNILDIFLSNNLNFPTMVGREAQFTIYKQKSGNNSIDKPPMLGEYLNIRTSPERVQTKFKAGCAGRN